MTAFIFAAVGITTYLIITGLFDIDFDAPNALGYLLLKSAFVGIVTGAILGVINMYLKLWPFIKSK